MWNGMVWYESEIGRKERGEQRPELLARSNKKDTSDARVRFLRVPFIYILSAAAAAIRIGTDYMTWVVVLLVLN